MNIKLYKIYNRVLVIFRHCYARKLHITAFSGMTDVKAIQSRWVRQMSPKTTLCVNKSVRYNQCEKQLTTTSHVSILFVCKKQKTIWTQVGKPPKFVASLPVLPTPVVTGKAHTH